MFPILGHLDALGLGADDRDSTILKLCSEVEGSLSAELHYGGITLLPLVDVEHIFKGEGFEKEFVAGVVVGGNGLGIGIHHDCFPSLFLEGECSMDTAIVELDALSNTVGPTPQDHRFLFDPLAGLILVTVGGVEIGRGRFKFGGAGINQPISRLHSLGFPLCTDRILRCAGNQGDLTV